MLLARFSSGLPHRMYGCHASVVGHTGWVARLQPVVGNQKFRRTHRDRACAPDWVVYGVRCERTGTCVRKEAIRSILGNAGTAKRGADPRSKPSRNGESPVQTSLFETYRNGISRGRRSFSDVRREFSHSESLTLFQQGLGESDLLLGFTLGKPAGDRLGAALHQRLAIGSGAWQRSFASWRTTTGVAWPIQMLERTAARRDNWLQALSAERGPRLGDGLHGLSRAWTMAGARTVVAFQVTGGGR